MRATTEQAGETHGGPVVAIIGGGFTGGTAAWNLARRVGDIRVIVFEPRAVLGAGLAYDTADPVHRINVPAARMSIDPDSPADFADWLAETRYADTDDASRTTGDTLFPRRKAFGDYVAARIEPFLSTGRIRHVRLRVTNLTRQDEAWILTTEDGSTYRADRVALATTHPAPTAPRLLAAMLEGHPRFVADATVPGALDAIRPSDSVLVVGNGLTSADVTASLIHRGHRAKLTSVSRRGLRSRGHAQAPQDPHGDFVSRPIRSARLLTRRIREAIVQADLFGVSWHAVIDAARGQGREIWSNLPIAERIRLVRHLRPFWDVHRFRIAPQVEQALDQATESDRLETLAGSIAAVSYHGGRIRAAIKLARSGGTIIRDFDAVVVTTGPAHNAIIDSQDYLADLAARGLAVMDPTRLGIWCDEHSRLLDHEGWPVPGLYVAGPLARGTFGELMGLPQVSEHAALVAAEIVASIEAPAKKSAGGA
ncbi:FAD/NAD(P)-binding protein [Rhizobium sp.]